MYRKFIIVTIALLAAFTGAAAQDQDPRLLVEMPVPPQHITRLDQRCNYIMDHYWDRTNFKSAFSAMDRLDYTMGQFFAFIPYATADTVFMAIDRLIQGVEKADAKNLLPLAAIAEKYCDVDTAEYQSDELYYPFLKALANNKKVKGAAKERFLARYRQLENSRTGAVVSNLRFTCPDGSQGDLADITAPHVLLMFYEPDCLDCRMARTRMGADYVLPALVENNIVAVVAVYPGEADDQWRTDADNFPDGWIVGAAPDIDRDFTIRDTPEIYYLDENRTVRMRGIKVDNALNFFQQFIKR